MMERCRDSGGQAVFIATPTYTMKTKMCFEVIKYFKVEPATGKYLLRLIKNNKEYYIQQFYTILQSTTFENILANYN